MIDLQGRISNILARNWIMKREKRIRGNALQFHRIVIEQYKALARSNILRWKKHIIYYCCDIWLFHVVSNCGRGMQKIENQYRLGFFFLENCACFNSFWTLGSILEGSCYCLCTCQHNLENIFPSRGCRKGMLVVAIYVCFSPVLSQFFAPARCEHLDHKKNYLVNNRTQWRWDGADEKLIPLVCDVHTKERCDIVENRKRKVYVSSNIQPKESISVHQQRQGSSGDYVNSGWHRTLLNTRPYEMRINCRCITVHWNERSFGHRGFLECNKFT